jgi:hypothetical protein
MPANDHKEYNMLDIVIAFGSYCLLIGTTLAMRRSLHLREARIGERQHRR